MRGRDISQDSFFSYGSLEDRIPQTHPLRPIRVVVDAALKRLARHFARLYAPLGRPSIAPEKLLRALLLMVLYSVRSERRLIEELEYNLLYRWFVGFGMDEPVWDATTSVRTASGSLMARWRAGFSIKCWPKPGSES